MESPVNSGEAPAVSTTKEPVKAEEEQASSNSGERSDEAGGSPPPNCSICLGKLVNTSFTDSCLHQFCFTCLLQWSRIKTECPLCKQTFKSIIHNVRSEEDYDQYHVPRETAPASVSATRIDLSFALTRASMAAAMRRFSYRTTLTPNRRYGILSTPLPPPPPRQESGSNSTSSVSHEERRYRRNIYRSGVWSDLVPDLYSRFRECSAEYYRRYPHEIDRLIPWINRDLQTLFNTNQPHIAYVLRVITDSLTRYDMRSPEFRDVLRPYFGINTDHFIHELMNYARTDLTITAYDDLITYLHHPGRGLSGAYWSQIQSQSSSSNSNSSTSDDSDVRVVDHLDQIDVEAPLVGPHLLSVAGPSTVSQTFQMEPPENRRPCVLTITSSSSESECEIIGYVKPRHERTPEIIELASSAEEETAVVNAIVTAIDTPRSPSPEPTTSHPSTSYESEQRRSHKKAPNTRITDFSTFLDSSASSSNSDSDTNSNYSQEKKQSNHRKKRTSKSSRGAVTRKVSSKKNNGASRKRNKYSISSTDSDNREPKKRRTTKGARGGWIFSSSSDDERDLRNVSKKLKDRNESAKIPSVRVRKDLMNDSRKHLKLLINSSTSSSSDSSSSSTSTSSSTSCVSSSSSSSSRFRKLRRKFVTRRQHKDSAHRFNNSSNQSDENDSRSSRSRLKSTVIKVNTTVLRKDSNKKEWYVDKKNSSRSRSRSRSLYNSGSDDVARRRADMNAYREKRAAQKIANEKIKNESLYFDSQNDDDDEESQRSNSQCSGYSERSRSDKHKNKNSSNITNKPRKSKSHKKSSKDSKAKQKRFQSKSKRDKRHKDSSTSSSSC